MSETEPSSLQVLQRLLASIPDDLALPQIRALVAIASEPGLAVTDLADRLGVPQQTASRHVAFLLGRYQDAMGGIPRILAEQRVSREDPRRRALFVTEEGAALLAIIVEAAASGQKGRGNA